MRKIFFIDYQWYAIKNDILRCRNLVLNELRYYLVNEKIRRLEISRIFRVIQAKALQTFFRGIPFSEPLLRVYEEGKGNKFLRNPRRVFLSGMTNNHSARRNNGAKPQMLAGLRRDGPSFGRWKSARIRPRSCLRTSHWDTLVTCHDLVRDR